MSAASDTEGLVTLALVGVGAYLLYQLVTKGPSVPAAIASAGLDAAENAGIINYGKASPGGTYDVTMPDGTVQTVPYGQLPNPSGAGITSSSPMTDAYGNDF
jgi:hypothetical protein